MNFDVLQHIIYTTKRKERFLKFIELYHSKLKTELELAFKVFKHAYTATDNIFSQIEQSDNKFDLKDFLKDLKNSNIDFIKFMTKEERGFYDSLPNQVKIFRGIHKKEHDTRNYGISWTLSESEAENYVNFKPNMVEKDKGRIISCTIDKNKILTVFSVYEDLNKPPKNEIIYVIENPAGNNE